MADYKYPAAWAGCPGDGGVIGAAPKFDTCVKQGKTPEEFFGCADVRIMAGGAGAAAPSPMSTSTTAAPLSTTAANQTETTMTVASDTTVTTGTTNMTSTIEAATGAVTGAATTAKLYGEASTAATAPLELAKATAPAGCQTTTTDEYDPKPDAPASKCATIWHPCGGKTHTGPTTCCDPKTECKEETAWYSQCVPIMPRRRR
jgi:Fungal cellulose binding domain